MTSLFKVVKVPSAWGVAHGILGEVLEECDSFIIANALLYETWIEDTDPRKVLSYHLEVIEIRSEDGTV